MTTALTAFNPFVLPSAAGVATAVAQHHIRQACIEFCKRTLVWRVVLPPVQSQSNPLQFTAPLSDGLGDILSGTLTAPFTGPTRIDYVMTFSDASQQVVQLTNGSTAVSWRDPVDLCTAFVTYSQVQYPFPVTTDGEISKFLKFIVDTGNNAVKRRVVTPDMAEDMVFYRYQQQDWDDIAWTTDRLNFNVSPPPLDNTIKYSCIVALQPTQTCTTIPDDIFGNYAETIAAGALARLLGGPKETWTDARLAAGKREYFEEQINKVGQQVAKGFSRGRRRALAHFF